jgi:hypothetical protein
VVFWIITPHSFIGGYQHFGETYYFHVQTEDEIKVKGKAVALHAMNA